MTDEAARKALVCLAADKNMEHALREIFGRDRSLGIRPIDFEIFVHPQSDPGCLNDSPELLRSMTGLYDFALVVFDYEGSGGNKRSPEELEKNLAERLSSNGWGERADVVVVQPELEAWVWSPSPHVAQTLKWQPKELRDWLIAEGFLESSGSGKPSEPKEAMAAALRKKGIPRSSSIYKSLASKVSLTGCEDRAFVRLGEILRGWFSPT